MSLPGSRPAAGAWACAIAAACIWTGFVLISRFGGVSSLTSWDVVALRYGGAAIVLLPFLRGLGPVNLRSLVVAVFGGVVYASLAFAAFRLLPAAVGGTLLAGVIPAATAVLTVAVGRERLAPRALAGLLLIVVGVGGLAVAGGLGRAGATGAALMLLAALAWSTQSVLMRRWGLDPWRTTMQVCLITAALFLPPYLLFAPKGLASTPSPTVVLVCVYQGGLAAVLQTWLYLRASRALGNGPVSALVALAPVGAALLAPLVLDETVPLLALPSIALVVAGAVRVALARPTPAATRPTPAAS